MAAVPITAVHSLEMASEDVVGLEHILGLVMAPGEAVVVVPAGGGGEGGGSRPDLRGGRTGWLDIPSISTSGWDSYCPLPAIPPPLPTSPQFFFSTSTCHL